MDSEINRLRIEIQGTVQGVGFRPFVYRLADRFSLKGWVNNSTSGLFIEVEGDRENLEKFRELVVEEKPKPAIINDIVSENSAPVGYETFEIKKSDDSGRANTDILPDLATCPDCLTDIEDSNNRRYRYPFTNCTNCGPRYSIIKALPYDRPNTSMVGFKMCESCREEYENPLNRRFHAQPNACPKCGPRLEWIEDGQSRVVEKEEALRRAEEYLRSGKIVALKGLGGFQLLVDARDSRAVGRLRERKNREAKPFALMYPGLQRVKDEFVISESELELLSSPAASIVLLERENDKVADNIAYENPYLGVMLPYTPLHHILLQDLGFPIVATSGNISGEPICINNEEAFEHLGDVADGFLVHDRPIVRPVDDSVACVSAGQKQIIRRARGYAPAPYTGVESEKTIFATGAQLKNTVSLLSGDRLITSQHLGDLDSLKSRDVYVKTAQELQEIYDKNPDVIACDLHPDYYPTQYAGASSVPTMKIQHHHAHVASCMLDNNLFGEILGVSWDGTGFGDDGTVWGGEFLLATRAGYRRAGYLKTFRLPGGEKAVKEPRRSLLGLLLEIYEEAEIPSVFPQIEKMFELSEIKLLARATRRRLNSPVTSSAGRLFDAVVALLDICYQASYPGEGPCRLEYAAHRSQSDERYSFKLEEGSHGTIIVDWIPLVQDIIQERQQKIPVEDIARKFHNTLAVIIANVAEESGLKRVALTGGCFQNRLLTRLAVEALREKNLRPYWHKNIPPGDGGISAGQAVAAADKFSRSN